MWSWSCDKRGFAFVRRTRRTCVPRFGSRPRLPSPPAWRRRGSAFERPSGEREHGCVTATVRGVCRAGSGTDLASPRRIAPRGMGDRREAQGASVVTHGGAHPRVYTGRTPARLRTARESAACVPGQDEPTQQRPQRFGRRARQCALGCRLRMAGREPNVQGWRGVVHVDFGSAGQGVRRCVRTLDSHS